MTSRERLLAAYAHQPVDCVPCSPRIYAWLLDRYGSCGPAEHLRAAKEFDFDPHLIYQDIRRAFRHVVGLHACQDSPVLPGITCVKRERTEAGYRVVRRTFETPDGPLTDETRFPPAGDRTYGVAPDPVRTEYLVKSRKDLGRLRHLIIGKDRTDFSAFFETERLVGERGLVMLEILSALCHRAGDACAMTDLMLLYYDDRSFFENILDVFQREMMSEVEAALAAGIRHFFANWYYNSLSVGWSPTIWKEVFAPQLREMTDRVHACGGTVNFFDDGRCMPILEVLADAGIDVLQTLCPPPVGDVDLAEAKRRIGGRVCLMGHVDLLYVIQRGTPELIDHTVRQAIERGTPGGGFILGTSDSIRDGTPIRNVRAYFDAARRYGCRI